MIKLKDLEWVPNHHFYNRMVYECDNWFCYVRLDENNDHQAVVYPYPRYPGKDTWYSKPWSTHLEALAEAKIFVWERHCEEEMIS